MDKKRDFLTLFANLAVPCKVLYIIYDRPRQKICQSLGKKDIKG